MKIILTTIMLALVLIGCGESEQQKVEKLLTEKNINGQAKQEALDIAKAQDEKGITATNGVGPYTVEEVMKNGRSKLFKNEVNYYMEYVQANVTDEEIKEQHWNYYQTGLRQEAKENNQDYGRYVSSLQKKLLVEMTREERMKRMLEITLNGHKKEKEIEKEKAAELVKRKAEEQIKKYKNTIKMSKDFIKNDPIHGSIDKYFDSIQEIKTQAIQRLAYESWRRNNDSFRIPRNKRSIAQAEIKKISEMEAKEQTEAISMLIAPYIEAAKKQLVRN